jgi:FkbM family methyltransferase
MDTTQQKFLDNLDNLRRDNPGIYDEIFQKNMYYVDPQDCQGRTLIDIGGYRGFFTLLALRYGIRECHTFEPLLKNYQMTVENLRLFPKAHVYHKAVVNRATKYVTITNQGGSSNIYNALQHHDVQLGPDETNVECTYLEEIVQNCGSNQNGFLLKMDCEGAEHDIVEDTPESVLKIFNYIYLEVHGKIHPNPKYNYEHIMKVLNEKGFEIDQGQTYGMWLPDGSFVPGNMWATVKLKRSVGC